jgi:hypothetical protein
VLGICLTCGHPSNIEQHHVAGRSNYPTLTVPVCVDCHRILTAWQRGHGVLLAHDNQPYEVDRLRALAVGVYDLFRLIAQRHPSRIALSPAVAVLTGRAFSRLFDLSAPHDRPGRTLPDPTQPPVEAVPVWWVEETALDLVVLLATLTVDVLACEPAEAAQAVEPKVLEALRRIIARPQQAQWGWEQLNADQQRARQLLADIGAQLERSQRLVRGLLDLHPDDTPAPELLDEIRLWFDTGRRLLDQLVSMVTAEVRA